jgi:hypothetical protein
MKRFRRHNLKDNELRVYWGKLPYDNPDIVFEWRGEPSMKRDSAMLHYHIATQRPDPSASPLYSKMLPSLLEELKTRGYDLTTLRFSIRKTTTSSD